MSRHSLCTSLIAGALAMSACASAPKPVVASVPALAAQPSPSASCDPARDRAAILGMAGTFAVKFAFDETEPESPGYALHAPYRTDATEVVAVLESSERHVVLQHVLLIEKHSGAHEAMKHWRQDWTFEDRELLEYRGQRTWEKRALSEDEARCTWSQAVFEVDDGPRYESYGRFAHGDGRAIWTSQETWRPLPRREYTQRNDYDVLRGTNQVAITSTGWQHAQDNSKYISSEKRALVHERGLNEYQRIESPDTVLAQQYLEQTSGFWSEVRAAWANELQHAGRIHIAQEISGAPLYEQLFPLAKATPNDAAPERRQSILELLQRFVAVQS